MRLGSEVVDRVTSLLPLKSQKNNSLSSFFDINIITSIGSKRTVCFDKRRYDLFQELNDSPTHGISIKRPRRDENDDIIITDFSKTKKVKVDHIAVQQLEVTPTNEALSEKRIFERFHVKGIFTNISAVKSHHNDDGSTLNLRTTFIHDNTSQREITIFGKISESLEENVHYLINHVYLGKYKYSRILKTSDVSTIKQTDQDPDFDITTKAVKSPVKNIECKFVTIDMNTTAKRIRCPDCNQEATADEGGIAVNENCALMICTDQCKVDDKFFCFIEILDQNNRK